MKKILLIEDNDDVRSNIAEILELSDYKVIEAQDGKIGLQKALQYNPDLILCDVMMPLLDGYGVLHAMHKNDSIKNTPFIFLTARAERNDFRHGMELGADDYLTKPFTGTELLNAVDSRLKKIDLLREELSHANGKEDKSKVEILTGDNLMELILEGSSTSIFKRKQLIYSEGNHANRLYYVLSGKVKLYRSNDHGKELVTELYSSGDFFGYVALLEGTICKDTAEALEDCKLSYISKDYFENLIYSNINMSRKFIRLLAKNISEKENQLLGFAYNSLRKKVAEALIWLRNKYQPDKKESFEIKINRNSLASIAGTATESLIRTLKDFKTEKLIDIKS